MAKVGMEVGGRESVNPNSRSHSKLLGIIFMAITYFLRMLPSYCLCFMLSAPVWLNSHRLESEKQMEFFLHRIK